MGMIKGQREYKKWQKGIKLTHKGAVLAMCYICNGYENSNEDCKARATCPLYPYSPYGS